MPAEAVGTVPSFIAMLGDEERTMLLGLSRRRRYRPNTLLFAEGDPSDAVFLIGSGRVKVTCSTENGREILLAVLDAGDLGGEVSALDGRPRSASGTALGLVEAFAIPSSRFQGFLREHPHVALTVLSRLCGKLRDADHTRVQNAVHTTPARVAQKLLDLVERFGERVGEGMRIDVAISQQDLAGWTGSSRESVNKALATMRGRGWVRTHRQSLIVVDPTALARCASGADLAQA